MTGPLSAVSRATGWIDIFARDGSGNVVTKSCYAASWMPSITGWTSLGKPTSNTFGAPVAIATSANRLDVFVREFLNDGTGVVYSKTWNGSWGPWQSLGGPGFNDAAAVSRSPGMITLFAVGTDRQLKRKEWSGSVWWPSLATWDSIGGGDIMEVGAVATASNRIDVFGHSSLTWTLYRWWDGSQWHP